MSRTISDVQTYSQSAFAGARKSRKMPRAARACAACRRRKIRCDTRRPACGYCQNLNTECVFSETTQKPGPPRGYVKKAAERLAQLESFFLSVVTLVTACNEGQIPDADSSIVEQIRTLIKNMADETPTDGLKMTKTWRERIGGWGEAKILSSNQHTSDTASSTLSSSSEYFSQDMITDTLSVDDRNVFRIHGPTSGLQFLPHIPNPSVTPYPLTQINEIPCSSTPPTPGSENLATLRSECCLGWVVNTHPVESLDSNDGGMQTHSLELQDKILEAYWTWTHPVTPVIRKSTFLTDLYANRVEGCRGEQTFMLLLNAMAALATFQNPNIPGTYSSLKYYYNARAYFAQAAFDWQSSTTVVQTLTLLSIYDLQRGFLISSWHISGFATRMAVDLGLCLDLEKRGMQKYLENSPTKSELEDRKRTWWTTFLHATMVSTIMGKPSQITDCMYDVTYPSLDEPGEERLWNWDPSESEDQKAVKLSPSRYVTLVTKIMQIQTKVTEAFFLASNEARENPRIADGLRQRFTKELDDLWSHVEDSMKYSEGPRKIPFSGLNIYFMNLAYNVTVILLNRSFVSWNGAQQSPSTPSSLNSSCRLICTRSANIVTTILEEIREKFGFRQSGMISYVPFNALLIHISNARQLSKLGTHPAYQESAKNGPKCSEYMKELEGGWPLAHDAGRVFEEWSGTTEREWLNPGSNRSNSSEAVVDVVTPQFFPSTSQPSPNVFLGGFEHDMGSGFMDAMQEDHTPVTSTSQWPHFSEPEPFLPNYSFTWNNTWNQ